MSTKIDTSTIYEMFEAIKSELRKQKSNEIAPTAQIDIVAVNAMTEQLENVIEEVKKPSKVEHRHAISVSNSWFSFSWVGLLIIILALSWIMGNQRQTIAQYRDSDLMFRYIRMQGQTNEESLFRLQQQFNHRDSVRIIRNRVEEFEKLVRLQAERMERAKINEVEMELMQNQVETLRNRQRE
jgi:hypothetical protein